MKCSGLPFLVALLLAPLACLKPEPVIYRVSLGMSEQSLLAAVGPPVARSEMGEEKTLEFRSWGKNLRGNPVNPHIWYVHLDHGRVDAYGWREEKPAPARS